MTVHSAAVQLDKVARISSDASFRSCFKLDASCGLRTILNPRTGWRTARVMWGSLLLAGSLSLAVPAFAVDKDQLALSMVQKYDFGRNLQIIGFAFAQQAQDYPKIVHTLGPGTGDALIQRHLAKLAAKYQSQWDAYLAASYSAVFSEDALQSFADQGAKNSHMAEFDAKRGQVGQLMREKSATLLTRYVNEALSTASEEMASMPSETVTAQAE